MIQDDKQDLMEEEDSPGLLRGIVERLDECIALLKRPVCLECGETMVPAHVEWEDGSWSTFWACGCETPEGIKGQRVEG